MSTHRFAHVDTDWPRCRLGSTGARLSLLVGLWFTALGCGSDDDTSDAVAGSAGLAGAATAGSDDEAGGRVGRGGSQGSSGEAGSVGGQGSGGAQQGGSAGESGAPVGEGGNQSFGGEQNLGGAEETGIAEWTDGPIPCPSGLPQRNIGSVEELEQAARGEGAFADDPPATCYLIANGTYASSNNVLFWVRVGGEVGSPRYFVGESRDGVIINARATLEVDHVVIQNVTFDLTGYEKEGSFNTISLEGTTDTVLDHLTLTGDCQTGSAGGHIELNNAVDTVIDSCIIEDFGNCADGHLEHGIYVASAQNTTIRNSIIRGNASRGIQIYTQQGEYGTVDGVLIEANRIYRNGHGDYEDGIAINGEDEGTIDNVTIQNNLIYENYFSGLRFVGDALSGIRVEHNTFFDNSVGSSNENRSEVNLDGDGSGAGTIITKNIFAVGYQFFNDCYSAASAGFTIEDNIVFGTGSTGDCISGSIEVDPEFTDADTADLHPNNPAVAGYGAYP